MSGISTGIELHDGFTSVISQIIDSMTACVDVAENMQQVMNTNMSAAAFDGVQNEIDATISRVNDLQSAMSGMESTDYSMDDSSMWTVHSLDKIVVPVEPVITEQPRIDVPERITVPVDAIVKNQPQVDIADGVDVPTLDTSNVQQYAEQIESVNSVLQQISSIQQFINDRSQGLDVIPDDVKEKIASVNQSIERMNQQLNMIQENPFGFDSEVVEQQIISVTNALRDALDVQRQLSDELSHMDVEIEEPPPIDVPVSTQTPDPVEIPTPEPVVIQVVWQTDGMEVFAGTGVERFQQEVQSADRMLEQLSSTQDAIARQAYNTSIFSPEAFQDLNGLAVRIDSVRDRIQQIENNPVNLGTDTANAELEQLRSQLNTAIQEQNELNQAMQNMDVSAANDAYLRLSQTVSGTERYIRDNVDEQGRFNQEIQEGTQQANGLTNMIKGAVAAYVSVQSVGKALNISDELTQTIARLNLMNDGAQTTQELFDKIYLSAQSTHSPLMGTANAIAKMGNNAGAAFSSNDELIAFMEQVNKQFVIGGASATEQSNAMMQLSQAMASGALRGDELNSILDAAPGIARTIEESMGWAEGSIKSYAEEGEVTAEVVKSSLLNMADETNAAFESMPITFSQAMTDFVSSAQRAFQPVLQRLNDIANSEAFQTFVNGAIEAMATLANVVLNIFELIGTVGGFIADNWSIISPIIYGVIGALAVYAAYLGIVKGIELASAAAKGVLAVAEFIHVAALAAQTGATISATAAQLGLNGAMYACPIVWIIMLIISMIAIIFAVCNAIAKMTGVTQSGFGLICGVVNVGVAFIRNLVIGLINAIIMQAVNLYNMLANFAAAFGVLFNDPVATIKAVMLSLFNFIVSVVSKAAAMLDAVFGSNLAAAVSQFHGKIQSEIDATIENAGGKAAETLNPADYMLDTVDYGDAFNAGALFGDGIADKVSNFSLSDIFGQTDIPNVSDYTSGFNDAITNSGVGDSVKNIDDNTGKIKDSLDVTEEDLKYLRDIAEQEAINRFTTAEINVDMSGMQNTVNSGDDIDGFMTKLTDSVNDAVDNMTEGVHE